MVVRGGVRAYRDGHPARLEVYRDPVRTAARRAGFKYATVRLLKRNATVTPLAAPRARIRVASLLP